MTLNGRDHLPGPIRLPESRAEYDRLMAEWLTNGRRLSSPASGVGSDLAVNEMLLAYLEHADGYYVKNGRPTKEPENIRFAIRPLRSFTDTPRHADFGPVGTEDSTKGDDRLRPLPERDQQADRQDRTSVQVGRLARKWSLRRSTMGSRPSPASVRAAPTSGSPNRSRRSRGVRRGHPAPRFPPGLGDGPTPTPHRGCGPARFASCGHATSTYRGGFGCTHPEVIRQNITANGGRIYLGPQAQKFSENGFDPILGHHFSNRGRRCRNDGTGCGRNRKTPVQPSQRDQASHRPGNDRD